ncbi:MAG TPA: CDF family Co(II)/Ni(II) efflux transporter DmeF [Alphaproteobacteria bacterium]|nr:CDF family Co(II)/Ni(II) efflux transporter DmeF [Alphaproteobacteria bacterium]
MTTRDLGLWRHDHLFLGSAHKRNERRAWAVMGLTLVMMAVELAAGSVFHSMALIADGWHMATHVGALGTTAAAYAYARRHAGDPAFTFGTGKFGDLAGFASAVSLALISLAIAYVSVGRLIHPERISFDAAIAVAAAGLVVNLVSAYLLHDDAEGAPGAYPHDHYGRDDAHSHGHAHPHAEHDENDLTHRHRDHNLRSARLHVLADGLTSLLAIFALSTGKYFGWVWMDPAMGIVGSVVIARWSYGLMRDTGLVLLDAQASPKLADGIRAAIESAPGDRVADLHVWRVGPGHFAAIVSVVTEQPRPAAEFKRRLAPWPELCHVTIEVNQTSAAGR